LHWQHQLEEILSENVTRARQRESETFDEASGRATSIVLVGAGNLGRRVLRELNNLNRDVVAFADSNPRLCGTLIGNIPVFSPDEAAKQFADTAVFVVCIWHPDRHEGVQHHLERMKELGAKRVVPFVWLFWKYPDIFLPYYLWNLPSRIPAHAKEISAACQALADDYARLQFVSQLELRSRADFSRQPALAAAPAYFATDLFTLLPDERFVDCGAFDGDTIRDFKTAAGGAFERIDAFESDPQNFASLQSMVAADPALQSRAVLHGKAVASTVGTVRFAPTGQGNAAISDHGELDVQCTTLDHSLDGHRPSFIKMDIEGGEIDALEGAAGTIKRNQPLLAICVYHRQSDLWRLPLLMHELEPESTLALRPYCLDGLDLVCYAIPPNRRL
jgi:FkbM family methyltransferase